MSRACQDRERIFLDGSPEEWAALEHHAATCDECRKELHDWKALSVAAEELRDYQEDRALWGRIEKALEQDRQRPSGMRRFWATLALWRHLPMGWQTGLVGALVLVLALSGVYLAWHGHSPAPNDESKLLKDSTLAEVERAERQYEAAIDKLATNAKPQLDLPATPLLASYKEKLMLLDSAIDELRAQTGQNPSNAHLRYQLLAMYREKQDTLREVLEAKP